jgi:1-acyl-sn-glycerol-3-phosphate acyltransferase
VESIRALTRLLAVSLTNLGFYVFLMGSDAMLWVYRRIRGDRRGTAGWRTRVFHAWGRAMARLLGMQVEVRGRAPQPPFVLVSNHLGYVDVVLLASLLHCVFVSKAEVRDWPVVGRLCASVDTLFIRRESKRDIPRVIEQMERIFRSGRGIVLFPEGTSSAGEGVLPFRPSLLASAARAGLPIHYASIGYRTRDGAPSAREAVCWWGEMPFGGHVMRLLGLSGFDARVVFGETPVAETDRKLLAQRLRTEVERRFRPVI